MKAQLKYANKIHAKYVIILGDDELAKQEAIIRFMETSEQETVPLNDVVNLIQYLVNDYNSSINNIIDQYTLDHGLDNLPMGNEKKYTRYYHYLTEKFESPNRKDDK